MHYQETLTVASLPIGSKLPQIAGLLIKGFFGSLMIMMLAGCDSSAPPSAPAEPPKVLEQAQPQASTPPAASQPATAKEADAAQGQQALEGRVTARWDALVARNFELAYTFETPSYRKVYDAAYYKGKFGDRVAWLGARVSKVKDLGGGVAEVMVKLRFKAAVPIPGMSVVQEETNLKEKWVQEEGTWFHVTE